MQFRALPILNSYQHSIKSCLDIFTNSVSLQVMNAALNPKAPVPLYRQLADLLLNGIRSGRVMPGSRLPSEHQMAAEHGVGRPTIRQAIDLLVRQGLLIRRRGSGTYVCDDQQEIDLFSLEGTFAAFQKKGVSVQTKLLSEVRLLHIEGGAVENPFNGREAYHFERLTSVDAAPVLLETFFLHAKLFAGIERLDLQGRSLSAIAAERYYLRPTGGRQRFRVGYAREQWARQLQVAPQTPLLAVQRHLNFPQMTDGVYSELWCRTDQYVFAQTIGGAVYA